VRVVAVTALSATADEPESLQVRDEFPNLPWHLGSIKLISLAAKSASSVRRPATTGPRLPFVEFYSGGGGAHLTLVLAAARGPIGPFGWAFHLVQNDLADAGTWMKQHGDPS
jgi:hypothetical protein